MRSQPSGWEGLSAIRYEVKKIYGGAHYLLHIDNNVYRVDLDIDSGKLVLRDGFRVLEVGSVGSLSTVERFAKVLGTLSSLKGDALAKLKSILIEIRSDALTRLRASQDVSEGRFTPALEVEVPPTIHGAGDIYVDLDGTLYVFEPIVIPGEVQFDSSHFVGKGFVILAAIHRPDGSVEYEEVVPSKNIEVNGKVFVLSPVVSYPEEVILWAEKDVLRKVKEGYQVNPRELFERIRSTVRRYVDQAEVYYTIDALFAMFTYFAKDLFDIAPQIPVRGLSEAGKSLSIVATGILSYHAYIGDATVAAVRRAVHLYKATPFIDELNKIENSPEWKTFILLCSNKMTAKQIQASKDDQRKVVIYNIYTPIIYVDFHESLERAIESRGIPKYMVRSTKEEYLVKIFSPTRYIEETKDIRVDLYLFRLQHAKRVLEAKQIVERLNEEKWKLKGRLKDIFYPLLVIAYIVDGMQEGAVVQEVKSYIEKLMEARTKLEQQTDEATVIEAIKEIYRDLRVCDCKKKDPERCCISFTRIADHIRKQYLVIESYRQGVRGTEIGAKEFSEETKRVSKEAEKWHSKRVGRILRNLLGEKADEFIDKHGVVMICIDDDVLKILEENLYAGILPKPPAQGRGNGGDGNNVQS